MEPECISHSFIAVMPKDSIRLPIIILVLERIRSESQIWKITGHAYRGQRLANDTWAVILGSFFTFFTFIYLLSQFHDRLGITSSTSKTQWTRTL